MGAFKDAQNINFSLEYKFFEGIEYGKIHIADLL